MNEMNGKLVSTVMNAAARVPSLFVFSDLLACMIFSLCIGSINRARRAVSETGLGMAVLSFLAYILLPKVRGRSVHIHHMTLRL